MSGAVAVLERHTALAGDVLPPGPVFVPGEWSVGEVVLPVSNEKYAHSLRTIKKFGECALSQTVEDSETIAARMMLRTDFNTAVGEMLSTDQEFRGKLDVNPQNTYSVEHKKVIMKNGKPVSAMIYDGVIASREAAKKDERMLTQATRDEADYENAVAVDALEPGQARVVLSMDPKEAMERDGEEFWSEKLGYRKGLAFAQWYCKTDDETVVAGSYAIDLSDKATWQHVFAEYGIDIPDGTPSDEWIKHAIEISATVEQTKELVCGLRARYYELRGATHQRHSVTEMVEDLEKPLIDHMFDQMYVPLAIAAHTGKKTEEMHDLATALLQNSASLSTEMRRELMRISNTETFDDQAARVMEFMIRYGTVEELRKRLPGLLNQGNAPVPAPQALQETRAFLSPPTFDPRMTAMLIAANVSAGATAGRSYGGCAAGFELAAKNADDNRRQEQDSSNPQGAYGGRDGSSAESSSNQVCDIETKNCYCCIYNGDGTPRKRPLTVVAIIDANKTIHCQRLGCGAYLAPGGQNKFIGYIAERGRALAAKAKEGAKA